MTRTSTLTDNHEVLATQDGYAYADGWAGLALGGPYVSLTIKSGGGPVTTRMSPIQARALAAQLIASADFTDHI